MSKLKFSEYLGNALSENEMTQKQLALKLNTTQQTVSRWLKGINEPDLSTLLDICLILNYTPNEILGYDDIIDDNAIKLEEFHYSDKTHRIKHIVKK